MGTAPQGVRAAVGRHKTKGDAKVNTSRQKTLVHSFLSALDEETRPLYEDLLACLMSLGYTPTKERSNLSFQHSLHNKQIAKMGFKSAKDRRPFFALRFSGCTGYSKRFVDIVDAYAAKYPTRTARCIKGGCSFCRGDAESHVYFPRVPGSKSQAHCGAYAIEIPDLVPADIEEIKRLIAKQHAYLLGQEASAV